MQRLVDDSRYQASVLDQLLFDDKKKVSVEIVTDSEPLLDSIGSTKQIEEKMLCDTIQDMKNMLEDRSIDNFRWISTKAMIADCLTKEKKDMLDLMKIVDENRYDRIDIQQKKVVCVDGEVKLTLRKKN